MDDRKAKRAQETKHEQMGSLQTNYVLRFTAPWYGGNGAITSISANLTEEQLGNLSLNAYEFVYGEGSNDTTGATTLLVGDTTLYVKDGKYLFINEYTENGNYITSKPTITFVAYDADGKLIASYIYKY